MEVLRRFSTRNYNNIHFNNPSVFPRPPTLGHPTSILFLFSSLSLSTAIHAASNTIVIIKRSAYCLTAKYFAPENLKRFLLCLHAWVCVCVSVWAPDTSHSYVVDVIIFEVSKECHAISHTRRGRREKRERSHCWVWGALYSLIEEIHIIC